MKTTIKNIVKSGVASLLCFAATVNAQWTGTSMNLNYTDLGNWAGNDINDTFSGNNWFSNQQISSNQYLLTAGSTNVITLPNSFASQLLVGQSITGDGIPAGAVVTAITGSTSFTISVAATRTTYASGTTNNDVYFSFNAGVTSITANNNNSTANALKNLFTVGQELNGYVGIADGTKVTAITNSGNNSTLTLDTPTTTSANLGLPAVNNNWNINTGNHTVKGDFTYVSPDVANVTLTPDNGTVWTFTAPNSRITVDMGAGKLNVGRSFYFGVNSRTLTLDFNGGNAVIDVSPFTTSAGAPGDGADIMYLYGTVINVASLTKAGAGILNIYRPVTATGAVTFGGAEYFKYKSTVQLDSDANGRGIITAEKLNILGTRHKLTLIARSSLNGADMLAANMPVNLHAGALQLNAQDLVTNQNVGPVHIYGRAAIGNITGRDDVTLTLSSLTRENFATVNLMGNNGGGRYLGNNIYIKISGNDQNILNSLVGSGGAAGSTTVSIIPWATAHAATDINNTDSSGWAGDNLVTYTTAGGFRSLTASEYVNVSGAGIMSAGATDNVNMTADITVSADKTVNAIKVTGGNITIADDQTLTVTSGVIGATNINGAKGTLHTGTNALITFRRASMAINGYLTNDITDPNQAGLIASNVDNFLVLQGVHKDYGGMTVVQTGLQANAAYVLPTSTELRIDRDGEARINYNNTIRKLSGVGWLTFGADNAVLNVNSTGANVLGPGNREVRISDGGILAPGDLSGDYRAGTLLLSTRGNGNNVLDVNKLTLDDGAIFEVDISATANDMVESDNFATKSTLNLMGGTIKLNYLDGYTPTVGETDTTFTWTLIKGFDYVTGDAADLTISDLAHPEWLDNSSGYGYDLLLNGADLILTLKLEAIPEPSTWALLLTAAALLTVVRRPRRE